MGVRDAGLIQCEELGPILHFAKKFFGNFRQGIARRDGVGFAEMRPCDDLPFSIRDRLQSGEVNRSFSGNATDS